MVKNPPASAGPRRDLRFHPWVGKIPWRRTWQPTPVFLPGESQGQRSLASYSPWGHKESNVTKWLSTHLCTPIPLEPSSLSPSHPCGSPQSPRPGLLCYTAAAHQLAILCVRVCVSWHGPLHSPSLPSHCVYKSILHICLHSFPANRLINAIFPDCIFMCLYAIFVFLFLTCCCCC